MVRAAQAITCLIDGYWLVTPRFAEDGLIRWDTSDRGTLVVPPRPNPVGVEELLVLTNRTFSQRSKSGQNKEESSCCEQNEGNMLLRERRVLWNHRGCEYFTFIRRVEL